MMDISTLLLKSKDEVASVFKDFHNMVINQFGEKFKNFRSNNGIEYIKGQISQYFRSQGIIHQTSCVGTPQKMALLREKIATFLKLQVHLCFRQTSLNDIGNLEFPLLYILSIGYRVELLITGHQLRF